jgi:FixJ family two-component response regulator/anti-sigma regulatory factor (Ser/Thr protein kinase)
MNTNSGNTDNTGFRDLRVLVVEDDVTNREFLRVALKRSGYEVVVAEGVLVAQQHLLTLGFSAFDCVVTDYRMPEYSGLDLLVWLKEMNAGLAAIIMTAEGEKNLVADSLRAGVVDFLEKPVDVQKLRAAITQAAQVTHQHRQTAEIQSAVVELGRTQARLVQSHRMGLPLQVELCFHPRSEAGGDFFSHFQPAPNTCCFLLTDVSGHDLKAAYLSAYFQGMVRGMLARTASLPQVCGYFNQLLLEEWNELGKLGGGTSVAVCAGIIDFHQLTAKVLTCGTPAPVQVMPDGPAHVLMDHGGPPLGWFETTSIPAREYPITTLDRFLLWTDGLEDFAEQSRVSPLSLGYALQEVRRGEREPLDLRSARDDILFVEVRLAAAEQPDSARWQPLVVETCHGGQADRIDERQAGWANSVKLAVPGIGESLLHDLLLASREAVLNSLQHGCKDNPAQLASFQISYQPQKRRFRVWARDPGPGHDFDPAIYELAGADELLDAHHGLLLMKCLATDLQLTQRGACVVMDFQVPPPIPTA